MSFAYPGPIEDTMEVMQIAKKGKTPNALQKCHIYCTYKQSMHLNEKHTDSHNPIFNSLYSHYYKEQPPFPIIPSHHPHYKINPNTPQYTVHHYTSPHAHISSTLSKYKKNLVGHLYIYMRINYIPESLQMQSMTVAKKYTLQSSQNNDTSCTLL
jgi:hypothetical protein